MIKERYRVTLGVFAAVFENPDKNSRILLVKHAYGEHGWSFPGGGVDRPINHQHSWNRMQEELKREILEETGTDVKLCPLVLSSLSPDSDDLRTVFFGMVNSLVRLHVANSSEISEVGWFPVGNLPRGLYFPQEIYIKEAYKLWPKVSHLVDL